MNQNKKHTGAYYTPRRLADYMAYRLFKEGNYRLDGAIDVLEPSVGDGIFLDALLNGNYYKDEKQLFSPRDVPFLRVDAIEINEGVAKRTAIKTSKYDPRLGYVKVINDDSLGYFLASNKRYDLIIGNPPYVRRRNMSKDIQDLCALVHKEGGIMDEKPKNLWTGFFAGAKKHLKEDGIIAFVLPTDLLQVKYTQEIRDILHKEFDRVEIFSLNWIYFDDIEQDVVILMCSNGHGKSKPKFFHIDSLSDLDEPKHSEDYDNSQRVTLNKWTNYILSEAEFKLLDRVHQQINPEQVKYYCNSGAGIVTAANDFFIVNQQVVEKYRLDEIIKRTIKKSSSMFPAVTLTKDDLERKAIEGAEIFFLDFPNKPKNDFPDSYKEYIDSGEARGLDRRYKMLLRNNWYSVPSVWNSEAFFTKRSNIFPRIISNEAKAYVTDAFYRIKMNEGVNVSNFIFAFHNTFTFIYAELSGRYYGGGVLELTPNEFKGLPVPYKSNFDIKVLQELDEMVRSGKTTEEILNYTDHKILREGGGISDTDIAALRRIYTKLLRRRLKKLEFSIG